PTPQEAQQMAEKNRFSHTVASTASAPVGPAASVLPADARKTPSVAMTWAPAGAIHERRGGRRYAAQPGSRKNASTPTPLGPERPSAVVTGNIAATTTVPAIGNHPAMSVPVTTTTTPAAGA